MRAEQDKETSGDHLAMMTSMSGFKFAVSLLFNSATEAMATATRRAREVTVLSIFFYLYFFITTFRLVRFDHIHNN